MSEKTTFDILHTIDVNQHTEKKSGLTYLSWAWAWAEVKKACPDATYEIKRDLETNLPYMYDKDTGYMVFTTVTIAGETLEMWLFVMDGANKAMKAEPYTYTVRSGDKEVQAASMFDINKTIMRCLVKNLAMFGLGLYIYAGEDLPEEDEEAKASANKLRKRMGESRDNLCEKRVEVLSEAFRDSGYESSLTDKAKWLIAVIKQVNSVEKFDVIEKRVDEIEAKSKEAGE